MSDDSQLELRPKDRDSALTLSRAGQALAVRGLNDAEALDRTRSTTEKLSKLIDELGEKRKQEFPCLRQRAEEGDASAQYELGAAYESGDCVPQDSAQAFSWYQKAAAQNHIFAVDALGEMYEKGEVVPADQAEARRLYYRAADIALAAMEGNGADRFFSEWDVDGVEDVIRTAAEHGHNAARRWLWAVWLYGAKHGRQLYQGYLGEKYARGEWVTRDDVQALMWLTLASEWFAPARDALASKMPHEKVAEAQRLAREFKPDPPVWG